MRPAILDSLFAPVTALPGIGPQLARLIERLAGPLVVDLLWHLPCGIVDRRAAPPIRESARRPTQIVTVKVRVEAHEPGIGRRPYRVLCARRDRHPDAGLFPRQGRLSGSACCRSAPSASSAAGSSSTTACQIAHPDHVVRARRGRSAEADRAGLPADRRPVAARGAAGGRRRRSSARPELPEWLDPALRAAPRLARLARGARRRPCARRARPISPCDTGAPAPRL